MSTRWARVVRGLLAALFATFVAAFFHVVTGGDVPAILGLTLSLAFSIPTCVILAGKRMRLWRLSVSVGLSQLVFHALFSLGASGATFEGAEGGHVHPGSHLTLVTSGASGQQMSGGMAGMLPNDPWMWAGHATAAVVTILALRHGEAAFWALLSTAAGHVVRLIRRVSIEAPVVAHLGPIEAHLLVLRDLGVLIGSMRHRGPPVGLVL
jgi:hypothetical protein